MTASSDVSSRRLVPFGLGVLVGSAVIVVLIVLVGGSIGNGQPRESNGPPTFVETAAVDHIYDGDFEFFVGGGVAVFDCDEDRLPDLFFAGGAQPAKLYRNVSDIGGRLRFENLPQPDTDLTGVTGAYPLDVDSDGRVDLAVLRVGANSMLRGLGDCLFEEANQTWGIDGGDDWTVAFSATWEQPSSLPTLAFGNYLALGEDGERTDRCADHALFRPDDDTYVAPIQLAPGWCALSILFSDWARSGSPDLRMTNDRHYYQDGEEQLWRFRPGIEPQPYTRADGWEQMQIWGMGIASHDVTGDGFPEVFLTSQGDNKLQTLAGGPDQPSFEDIALEAGANVPRPYAGDVNRPSTAWHAEFDDVNNDGYVDLFVTKGNVEAMPEFAQDDPNNLLLGQAGNRFLESAAEAGLIDFARSRGAAVSDLNLDGLLDVIVVDRREPVRMWQNVGRGTGEEPEQLGNWLAIELTQPSPNRDAIGAWIEVRSDHVTTSRELTVGGGHAGGELGWNHFGLGKDQTAQVRIRWPDGELSSWMEISAGRFWIIEREALPIEWMPD